MDRRHRYRDRDGDANRHELDSLGRGHTHDGVRLDTHDRRGVRDGRAHHAATPARCRRGILGAGVDGSVRALAVRSGALVHEREGTPGVADPSPHRAGTRHGCRAALRHAAEGDTPAAARLTGRRAPARAGRSEDAGPARGAAGSARRCRPQREPRSIDRGAARPHRGRSHSRAGPCTTAPQGRRCGARNDPAESAATACGDGNGAEFDDGPGARARPHARHQCAGGRLSGDRRGAAAVSPGVAPDRLFPDFRGAVAGRSSRERERGGGGMGVVYLARGVRLDRPVAIKLLPPSKTADPHLRERFLREARTAAKLSHPNVIPIYAVEELGEFVFFAMAYVEGETLTERVRSRGPLAPSEAARVLRDVAWALAHAHGQGVIHRDVKPDNILLESSGRVLVADFGIAGVVAGAGALAGGEVIGTPEFMSPEQALGEATDGRSDLYSLGIVGYFILSGTLPFEGEKATEVLARQVTEPAPALGRIAPVVPRRLAQAIDRCLSKDRADRPDGTAALAEQLGQALEQRRDVPAPLRVFVKGSRSTGVGMALLYLYGVFVVTMGVGMLSSPSIRLLARAGLLVAGPLSLLGWEAPGVTRLGYGQQDVDYAFQVELEPSREERAFEYGVIAPRGEVLTRGIALGGLVF